MDLYSICIAIGIFVILLLADRMGIKRGFSIGLQKLLIIAIVGGVMVGFLGGILFQAVYHWIDTGEFTLKAGMTFYGGLIFGAGTVLFCWFVLSKPFKVYDEAVAKFKDLANMAAC
jgi:prolipoprotein diacylglyceryltransferase